MEIPDGIAAFIEFAIYATVAFAGVFSALNLLKKEESFKHFLIGDLDDE